MTTPASEGEYIARGEAHIGWSVTTAGPGVVVVNDGQSSWALYARIYDRAWARVYEDDDGAPETWDPGLLAREVCYHQKRLGPIAALGGNILDWGAGDEVAALKAAAA